MFYFVSSYQRNHQFSFKKIGNPYYHNSLRKYFHLYPLKAKPDIIISIKTRLSMFAKIKQAFFTDSLTIEWDRVTSNPLKFVLKNDQGEICSTLETIQGSDQKYFNWRGLNDLPYGRYFLELSNTEGDQLLKLVKRV